MEEMLAGESEAERTRPPRPRSAPWLVYPHGKDRKSQTFYNLCDPNRTYLRSIPEMSRKSYWQSTSHQGWLIIHCDDDNSAGESNEANDLNSDPKWGDCFLWNPVSLVKIQLPRLDTSEFDQHRLRQCVLSAPPSNLCDSMVFFLYHANDCSTTPDLLLYCHPGDKQWRTMELSIKKDGLPGQLFCFKGRVFYEYVIDMEHKFKELVHNDQSHTIKTFNVNFKPEYSEPPPLIGTVNDRRTCFVESFDELFKVDVFYYAEQLVTFKVTRMDFSLMTWNKVKSLGDHVLFIGFQTSASCSAAGLGYASGCVYFIDFKDKSLYTFDLEDGSISVTLPCQNLPTQCLPPEWVIMPTTDRVTNVTRAEHFQKRRRIEVVIIDEEENKIEEHDKEEEMINKIKLKQAGTWRNLHAVCEAYRLGIPSVKGRTSSIKSAQTTCISPWLVFVKGDNAIYNFLDPMHNKKYTVNLSELFLDCKILFSKGGWLLMSEDDENFFFFNPLTREMIKLPELPDLEFMISGISFSSLPTFSDCTVTAIGHCSGCCMHQVHILLTTRGESSWTEYDLKNTKIPSKEKIMEFKLCLSNPIFYAEAFYCLDCNGTLGVFDLLDGYSWRVLSKPRPPCEAIDRSFLVECEGKLLAVFLGHLGKWVRIYRLDFTRMIWVEVKSLEKNMLFVSRSSSISVVAPDSRMENKIFFPRFHGEGIIFYSLDTGKYHSLGSRHCAPDFYNTKEQIHSSWIEPNWSKSADQVLDWLHV